jgi:hypothetical protein
LGFLLEVSQVNEDYSAACSEHQSCETDERLERAFLRAIGASNPKILALRSSDLPIFL